MKHEEMIKMLKKALKLDKPIGKYELKLDKNVI